MGSHRFAINPRNPIVAKLLAWIQHYDHQKYWRRRQYVCQGGGGGKFKKLLYLIYIKRCDAFNKASTGVDLNGGAIFDEPPRLPHGLNGIIVAQHSHIGKNVCIFHQVTIGNDNRDCMNVPTIEDNVVIYPGAKIVGKVTIGKNSIIGANAVVVKDVPPNSVVVVNEQRIFARKDKN